MAWHYSHGRLEPERIYFLLQITDSYKEASTGGAWLAERKGAATPQSRR